MYTIKLKNGEWLEFCDFDLPVVLEWSPDHTDLLVRELVDGKPGRRVATLHRDFSEEDETGISLILDLGWGPLIAPLRASDAEELRRGDYE